MNHRDRVLAALRYEEPDRIPIDFGGTVDTTISVFGYQALRDWLGLRPSITRIQDIYQYTAVIEDDVRQALDVDTLPVLDEATDWRRGKAADGSPAEFPAKFQPQPQADGSHVVLNAAGSVVLRMPAQGYYFDPVHSPLANASSVQDIERCQTEIESYDKPEHLDKSYEELAQKARALRENTDYLLVGFFGGHLFQAAQSLRGWEEFLMDLVANRTFAEALLDRLAEANIRRFEKYAATVGRYVHVVHFEDDLGMQDRPLLRPELYRQAVKPYHARLFRFAKSHCDAFLLLHTDGAVAPLIPDFIEMGIDALNPIQVSAAGMDTAQLKREFGRDIAFWGAGCDSQTVLPFGTPRQVADEVRKRIDDLAPGGGFVFGPIHNVQAKVPTENLGAMFEMALSYGVYRS
jgi:uroporphyrinogen decarboxylase